MAKTFRPVLFRNGTKFTTKTISGEKPYYELVFSSIDTGAGTCNCQLKRYKADDSLDVSTDYSGKFKKSKNGVRLVATFQDTAEGLSAFQVVIKSHESSPLRDRLRIVSGAIDDVLGAVGNADTLVVDNSQRSIVGVSDPEVESFQRSGTPASAPTSTSGLDVTTSDQPGSIIKGSVVVRKGANLTPYAYDNGANGLIRYDDDSAPNVGTIVYKGGGGPYNWSVLIKNVNAADGYYVEAIRDV